MFFEKDDIKQGNESLIDETNIKNNLLLNLNNDIDIEQLYDKISHIDTEGWLILEVVKELIPCNIYSEFYYEDNLGYFEEFNGYDFIEYYEIAEFSEREYEFVGNMHEKMISYKPYENTEEYKIYIKKLYYNTVVKIINKEPISVLKLLSNIEK